MQRRHLMKSMAGGIAGGLCGMGPAAWAETAALPVPPGGEMAFKVFRAGRLIGEHHMTFTRNGDQLLVDTDAALVVRIAGIPLFRYHVNAREYWDGNRFSGLDSQVNHNGTRLSVNAEPVAGGFAVQSTKAGDYDYTSRPSLMPLTYWNKAMLNAMILNVETGHHYPGIVSSPGWNYLPTAEGGKLLAQRFDMTGKLHQSVWYDQYGQWAGLQFNFSGLITLEKIVG